MASKKKKGSFWSDGVSVDETKFSVTIVMAVVGFVYALTAHYRTGEISDNLLGLVETLVYSILGLNGVKFLSDVVQKKNKKRDEGTYNDGAVEDDYKLQDGEE